MPSSIVLVDGKSVFEIGAIKDDQQQYIMRRMATVIFEFLFQKHNPNREIRTHPFLPKVPWKNNIT